MKSRFPSTVSANPSLSSSWINHSFTDSWNTNTSIFAEQFQKFKIWKIFNEDVMASLTIYILENRQGIPCRFFLRLLCILKAFFFHRTNLNTCMIIFQMMTLHLREQLTWDGNHSEIPTHRRIHRSSQVKIGSFARKMARQWCSFDQNITLSGFYLRQVLWTQLM